MGSPLLLGEGFLQRLTDGFMNDQWLILLSGASSSGKTTAAQALAKRLSTQGRPFLSIEADEYLPHMPDDWSHTTFGSSLSRAVHRSIAAFAEQGFDIIADGVLPYGDPESIADALDVFSRFRLCYVGVRCDPDLLETREKARPDRNQGWALKQQSDLHDGQRYDVEIDSSIASAMENADLIARYLTDRDSELA
jgi:chloramphenicol 3-O phosphotransferase